MKLDEFVEQSLSDILSGVNNARSKSQELLVGASSRAHFKQLLPGIMQDTQGALYTSVDFDVAVTVSNNGNGEASINVMGVKFGGGAGTDHQTVSRVKFSVPIKFS